MSQRIRLVSTLVPLNPLVPPSIWFFRRMKLSTNTSAAFRRVSNPLRTALMPGVRTAMAMKSPNLFSTRSRFSGFSSRNTRLACFSQAPSLMAACSSEGADRRIMFSSTSSRRDFPTNCSSEGTCWSAFQRPRMKAPAVPKIPPSTAPPNTLMLLSAALRVSWRGWSAASPIAAPSPSWTAPRPAPARSPGFTAAEISRAWRAIVPIGRKFSGLRVPATRAAPNPMSPPSARARRFSLSSSIRLLMKRVSADDLELMKLEEYSSYPAMSSSRKAT